LYIHSSILGDKNDLKSSQGIITTYDNDDDEKDLGVYSYIHVCINKNIVTINALNYVDAPIKWHNALNCCVH
jgi:hypothetical protein